jgi:hypothetical protein
MTTVASHQRPSYTPPAGAPRRQSLGLRGFAETLNAESDQACAVLAAAFLNASLEELFRARLRPVADPALVLSLLAPGGPLAAFAARIDMARALGWVNDVEHVDLHIVRRVGEAFASDVRHELSFSDARVRRACEGLEHANAFLAEAGMPDSVFSGEVLAELQENARHRFEMAIGFLRGALSFRAAELRDARGGVG